MPITRRKTLGLIGGGTIFAATAGIGGFAATRTPKAALAPWATAGTYDEPRMFALSYAILAPNPHNRQPWLVELKGDDTVILHRDTARDLPHTDPFQRQLVIGLGCFLELMTIAASEIDYAVDLQIYPEGGAGPVAIATFRKGAIKDPLFAMIPHRRTCRNPYADTPIPAEVVDQLTGFATILTQPKQVAEIRALTWEAANIEIHTPAMQRESVDLTRFGKSEINANPDGITLGGTFLEGLMAFGLLTREGQMNPESREFTTYVDTYHNWLANTPAYAVITSTGNTRADQINAGRKWVRLNLQATALGLSLQPVSQALQEYPEMSEQYATVHRLLAKPGETVQMLGRLGYGPDVGKSPRWPLKTRMLDG